MERDVGFRMFLSTTSWAGDMWHVPGVESTQLLVGRCVYAKSGDRFLFIQFVT